MRVQQYLNNTAKIVPIVTKVLTAFLGAGFLKFVTALDIASTPVSDDAPDENAFKSKNNNTGHSTTYSGMNMWCDLSSSYAKCPNDYQNN